MSSYRPTTSLNRKRRRPHSPYISNELKLELENHHHPQPNELIPDDDRVFRLLNKLISLSSSSNSSSPTTLVFVLSASERLYLESEQISTILRDRFGLSGLEMASQSPGSIETLAMAYGNTAAVVSSAVYISFCLCAKIKDVSRWSTYTLKSLNFKLQLIIPKVINDSVLDALSRSSELTSMDSCSTTLHHCVHTEVQAIQIRSDLHSMMVFLSKLLELDQFKLVSPLQLKDFTSNPIFAVANEPALYKRHETVLMESKNAILDYVLQ
ncbi:uncharacterized protein KQ657_000349 [Scheffersomyces spartinae]|uniref:Uncharacterized protein n=1 Tax=Scheffersomyces spartinae TaxID=45513 RepID=A0A9P8AIH1_9ASCO|nr:uncharacterized protein KQ657_000349 [Scheffersomyces spartinae]KAG7193664.1 hypothetical protein KQ657_000349 [Scheffersomyces spartinae]